MNKLKQLTEANAALQAEAAKLDSSKAEDRARLDALVAEIADNDAAIAAEVQLQNIRSRAAPELSKQEQRDVGKFDLGAVLRGLRGGLNRLDGVERELVAEGEKEVRASNLNIGDGVMLPSFLVRALNATGAATEGGLTIATEKRGLLDDFFAASAMHQAGATVITGLSGNIDLPRIHADPVDPQGKAELADADAQSPSFAMLELRPKRLPAYIDVSDQLLFQSSPALEAVLRGQLTSKLGVVQERAFWHGTGTLEATGIAATTGIGSVAGGTDGAKPALQQLVELETAVDTQNALQGTLHYVTNGAVRGALKTTPVVASTDSRRLLESNTGDLNGYTPLFTNAISRTLSKGKAANKCSAIFFGNFADYVCAYWGGLALELVRDRKNAISGQQTIVASVYYDGGVVRPKSFAAQLDVLTS